MINTAPITNEEYQREERSQTIHRSVNTMLSTLVLILGFFFIQSTVTPIYEQLSGLKQEKIIQSEIAQVVEDEGYKRCVYKDSLHLPTVGFGHLMLPTDNFTCIDPHYAVALLRKDYISASNDVEKRYPWAEDDVRLLLINLTFNMGPTRLAKFTGTLRALELKDYDKAAGELLDSTYAKQVPHRAARIAGRIMRLAP